MRIEKIGPHVLYLGNSLEIMPTINVVDHLISDPPYEKTLHDSKEKLQTRLRSDKGPDLKGLGFNSIDAVRDEVVFDAANVCSGWFIAFCTVEGVSKWADAINLSPMKYKRACAWIKPDSTPQLNGQGPAQGFECFVAAWNSKGHAKWNAGGKRGVYTHNTNSRDRQGEHPTEKPVNLMREIVGDFTNRGQTILDPFMGSGTTGVACAAMGRNFIGIEMDERWFDIACTRIDEAEKNKDIFVEMANQTMSPMDFE